MATHWNPVHWILGQARNDGCWFSPMRQCPVLLLVHSGSMQALLQRPDSLMLRSVANRGAQCVKSHSTCYAFRATIAGIPEGDF